jgi:nucleotide-binding universal stress UspA family protein
MIKRILVALDGSASAQAALAEATAWAARADARLAGVFVEDETRFFFLPTITYSISTSSDE